MGRFSKAEAAQSRNWGRVHGDLALGPLGALPLPGHREIAKSECRLQGGFPTTRWSASVTAPAPIEIVLRMLASVSGSDNGLLQFLASFCDVLGLTQPDSTLSRAASLCNERSSDLIVGRRWEAPDGRLAGMGQTNRCVR